VHTSVPVEAISPQQRSAGPGPRAWWRGLWDGRTPAVTSGPPGGTNGGSTPKFWRAYAAAAGLIAVVDTVNVLSALHDAARRGQSLAAWEPITWEATSGLAELLVCPLIYLALRWAPPASRRGWRTLLVHGAASLVFSALHVGLMMALRIAIYATQGFHYRVEAGAAPYEYRKDLLAYLVLAGLFHLLEGRRVAVRPEPAAPPSEPAHPLFEILDGGRTLRVSPGDILAIKSGGNYAEFHLADGRRPLMRVTLSDLAARLEPFGVERIHRSWLVNVHRVRSVEPAGSGDYLLELGPDLQVPLSRRFPSVLAKLRSG
jgi:hypothetical protein